MPELDSERQHRLQECEAGRGAERAHEGVLRRNAAERINGQTVAAVLEDELAEPACAPFHARSEDNIRRLQGFGLYLDNLEVGDYTLRIRIPNGILTAARLQTIGELAIRYGNGGAEIITCQGIQLNGIRPDMAPEVCALLENAKLLTHDGCGDALGMLTGCPVAGLDPEELFDVSPLVLAARRRFSGNPAHADLLRKHKWAISACAYDCCAPEVHDLALVGTIQDGRPGFAIWVGGDGTSTGRLATSLGAFATQEEALDVIQALLDEWQFDLRCRIPPREAFLHVMVDYYGPRKIREMVEARLGRPLTNLRENPSPLGWTHHLGIHAQRQDNLYYVGFPVSAGTLTGEQLRAIAEIVGGCGDEIRLTRQQNLVLTGIPECGVDAVVALMEEEAGISLETGTRTAVF